MIICSFTTTSYRVNGIEETLNSIREGSIQPDKILMNVASAPAPWPLQDKGIWQKDIPSFLQKYEVETHFEEINYGPFCKLSRALTHYNQDTIITFDDDRIYPKNWLEAILDLSQQHKGYCVCNFGQLILQVQPKFLWTTIENPVSGLNVFPASCFGIVLRTKWLNSRIFHFENLIKHCITNEEFWVYMHLKVPVYCRPVERFALNPAQKGTFNLSSINGGPHRPNDNAWCTNEIIQYYQNDLYECIINTNRQPIYE